ncbi:MAG: TetR/AcrR family transcriptional regulator [Deltaproteobacteria bacterium]|nr:TetR/AcrR family transcriptional regulator [Deltaproteobacteria bacterium]
MPRKILRSAKKSNSLIRDQNLLEQKREAVAEAAFELFLKEGFHRTTTRDIARRAGVSAGAPFTYFKDKEDILFYIVSKEQDRSGEQLLSALSQQIAEATHTNADPEDVFRNVLATYLRGVNEIRRFILLAYQETKSLNTETRQRLIAREKRLQVLIGEAIRYGVERGRFAPDNIGLKAHNIMVLAHAWAVRHWAFAGEMASIEEYVAFLQPLVLAMLGARTVKEISPPMLRPLTVLQRRVSGEQGEMLAK